MNEGDARQASDAELFEQWLEGRVPETDPKVDELFHRRPQWRELSELSRNPPDERRAAPWGEPASEDDRRFVAECLAEARARPTLRAVPEARGAAAERGAQDVRGVPDARVAPGPKHWPRFLIALAALVLVSWLARMWWLGERAPVREPGELLGPDEQVDSFEWEKAAADFSWFEWKCKPLRSGSERFALTIWAVDSNGARGRVLFPPHPTTAMRYAIQDATRQDWPVEVIWRVDRVDTNGVPTTRGPEWHARRTAR